MWRLISILSLALFAASSSGCSTTVVGRLASATGAVLASHSNDGDGGGFYHSSLDRVLAADWPAGSNRSVKGHNISQVPHTYAYHTEGYAAMNEHQVGLAESTCSGRSFPATNAPRAGFMNIVQLGQLALERANSSRAAVRVMGELSETWGYNDAAESLLVIDPREAFIFQIMPDPTGNASLWVAQRVPDDHVGSVTNGLTVRNVDFSDAVNFMSSGATCKAGGCALRAVAKKYKLWTSGPLDFTKTFAAGGIGEPSQGAQVYVSRRMWSAYRRFGGPELPSNISDFIMDAPYPATVPVKKGSVRLQDVMGVMRDYYEGTEFDMTRGMAAGPFGAPDRFGGNSSGPHGCWERTIATHHSIVSLVLEARSWLPDPVGGTLWFAPHAAHTSTYAPFPCGMNVLPASYTNGSGWGTPNPGVAAWANRAVFAAVQGRFKDAIVQLNTTRAALDNASLALQASTDAAYKAGTLAMPAICKLFAANADAIVAGWWELHNDLVHTTTRDAGYPAWWLKSPDVKYSKPLGGGAQKSCVLLSCGSEGGSVSLACVLRCLS